MTAMDAWEGNENEVEYWLGADLAAYAYGMPIEIFVRAAHSGQIRAWVDGDGELMVNCNDTVALVGQIGYYYWR